MRARVVVFLAALTGAAAVAAGSPAVQAVSCAASGVDVICRLTTTLTLTPAGGVTTTVTDSIGHVIASLTRADTSIYGSARVYFKHTATCQMMRPTAAGTRIYTRTPAGYLYSQTKGWTTCTFSDGTKAHIVGKGKQPAFAQVPQFFADLTASTGGRGFTQFRAVYLPASYLRVAVYKGLLVVNLVGGKTYRVAAGQELVVRLTPNEQIRSVTLRPATFSTREKSLFATQRKQLG